jgi:hypothetical protein
MAGGSQSVLSTGVAHEPPPVGIVDKKSHLSFMILVEESRLGVVVEYRRGDEEPVAAVVMLLGLSKVRFPENSLDGHGMYAIRGNDEIRLDDFVAIKPD